jgi:hypothetical protein
VDCEFSWQLRRGARERGLGDNLDFVHALGKIRGLEKLVISGYYAKNWAAYLEERMGVQVRAICVITTYDFRLCCKSKPQLVDNLKWSGHPQPILIIKIADQSG